MIVTPDKGKKGLIKFITILFNSLCIFFCFITIAIYFASEDNNGFWLFFTFTIAYSTSWILIYKFYLRKFKEK